jgi:hypothetical protein
MTYADSSSWVKTRSGMPMTLRDWEMILCGRKRR